MKSYGIGIVVLLTTFLVSACGGTDSHVQAPRSTDNPVITGQPTGFNADDVTFANDMVTLYLQTIELTALVPQRSTDPNLITLASGMTAAQAPDLHTMKVFLVQWGSNSDAGASPGEHGNTTKGVVDDVTMARLNSLSGAEFDALWLRSMIEHQQGAVETAKAEIAHGSNVDAVATAKQIVGTNQARISQMRQALDGLPPTHG